MNENDLFLKSDPELDKKLEACDDPNKIRELVKNHFAERGIIEVERGNEFGAVVIRMPEPEVHAPVVAQPVNRPAPTCVRVVYPFQNDRYEIFGVSEAELDAKENQIRQMYGGGGSHR